MAGAKPGVHVLQLKPISVPPALIEGDKFVKWDEDNSSGIPVTLKVDPHGFYLFWTYYSGSEHHETDVLDIACIRDTRTNKFARVPKDAKLREQINFGSSEFSIEQKTLTVVHGASFVDLYFTNFVGSRPETIKVWADEILKMAYNLLALNAAPIVFLRKMHTRLCIMKDKHGRIPVKNVVKQFARHNDDRKRVEEALAQVNLPSGKNGAVPCEAFTWDTFMKFYHHLVFRVEVEKVFCSLIQQSADTKRSTKLMTVIQLVEFLNNYQRDPRLNEILYPYADNHKAKEIIQQYESNEENLKNCLLSCEGFLNYLMSDDNSVISLEKLDLHEDMGQSLTQYFINSSHNTYLIGHQFTGKSSVEMYRQCLLVGCRCVELDFWNGKTEEPVIVHGYTLVPEVSAKEVIEAIGDAAFKTSEWPVILSFENHCNPKQQAKIAQYCREFFGDTLLESPLENYPLAPGQSLPPPASLKRKIIIKNKKKHKLHHHSKSTVGDFQFHVDLNVAAIVTEDTRVGQSQSNGEIPRPPMDSEPSKESEEDVNMANGDIPDGAGAADEDEDTTSSDEEDVERRPVQNRDGSDRTEEEAGAEISALVNYVQPVTFHSFEVAEKKNRSYEMSSFVETQSLNLLKELPMEFVNYNKRQLSRVYPKGTRVDSSNFLPHQFWNAGCHLVALNYQTLDLPMQLNLGLFEYNNMSGYLLKPDFMRRPDKKFDPFAVTTVDGIIAGKVSVKVISGQFLSDKRAGCYVEVEMYGLPADTVRKKFKTKTVPNNCINPVWDEDPFVFEKVVLPEMATIRIAAYEDSSRSILGHRVIPIVGIRPGYKHISLRNECGQPLGLPTLFVHIKVGDYVPDVLSNFAEALANPIKYQSELEKRAHQLSVFQDEEEIELPEEDGGIEPRTPLQKTMSNVLPNTSLSPSFYDDELVSKEPTSRTRSTGNGDVSSRHTDSTPIGNRRQNSLSQKQQLGPKVSDEKPVTEPVPSRLITDVVLAKTLDDLWSHKNVREKKMEIEKYMKKVRKKFEKEKQILESQFTKEKNDVKKSGHSLLKKHSRRNISWSASQLEEDAKRRYDQLQLNFEEALKEICRQCLQDERKILEKNYEPLFVSLDKAIKMSQEGETKQLQLIHSRSVDDCRKKQDVYLREEMKPLSRTTSDKQELDRRKREIRNNIVARGIQERQRLEDLFDKKINELSKQHEEVQKKFEEEKEKYLQKIDKEFKEKMTQIENDVLNFSLSS